MDLCLCQWEGQMVWERACITCDKLLLTFSIHLNKTRNPPSFSPAKRSSAPQWLKQTKGSSRSMRSLSTDENACSETHSNVHDSGKFWVLCLKFAQIYIPWQYNNFFFFFFMTFFKSFYKKTMFFFVFLIQNLTFNSNVYFLFLLMTKIHQQFLRANIFKVNST